MTPCGCTTNLTTIMPDIVAVIVAERLLPEVTLFVLAAGTALLWDEQWGRLRGVDGRIFLATLSSS